MYPAESAPQENPPVHEHLGAAPIHFRRQCRGNHIWPMTLLWTP